MAYTTVPDKASGDTFFEANWDTSIRDNLNTGIWRPIGDTVLTGAVGAITFSSIANSWAHLCLLTFLRSDLATTGDETGLRFNGDTGANYDAQQLTNNSATTLIGTESLASSSILAGAHPCATAPSGAMGGLTAFIPHYTNTANNKCVYSWCAFKQGTSTGGINCRYCSGQWRNNSAITSITLVPRGGGNWVAGSRAILYGVPFI